MAIESREGKPGRARYVQTLVAFEHYVTLRQEALRQDIPVGVLLRRILEEYIESLKKE